MEVRASAGESFLGGEDFTRALAARLLQEQGKNFERLEFEAPLQVARLVQQCEVAKRQLSRAVSCEVRIPDKNGDCPPGSPAVVVQREDFDRWTAAHLARVELPIRKALGDVRLKPSDISEVILVGGATRMPSVVERVSTMLGQPPQCRLNPDEVVALGAAVQAGLIACNRSVEDLLVTDVCPFTLGIDVSKKFGSTQKEGYFLPIIERNTTIPVSRVRSICTIAANQPLIAIDIYQGESRRVEDNLLLGKFRVQGIPPGPAGSQQVEIRFTYDLNGVLEAEARIVATGATVSHLVTKFAHGLTPEQIAAAQAAMQQLKTHPREEAANRFLMRRAERVYRELSLYDRQSLSELIDGFDGAIELGDKDAIESNRAALSEFLDYHDPGGLDDDDAP